MAFERDGVGGLSFVFFGKELAEEEELLLLPLFECVVFLSKGMAVGSISRDLSQLLSRQCVLLGCFAPRKLPDGVSVGVCEGEMCCVLVFDGRETKHVNQITVKGKSGA